MIGLYLPHILIPYQSRRAQKASWRASAQAITLKWQLCPTSPVNTNSSASENGFSAKNRSWPFINQSKKVQTGKTTEMSVLSQASIFFSVGRPKWAVSPVFQALGGPKGNVYHQKEKAKIVLFGPLLASSVALRQPRRAD